MCQFTQAWIGKCNTPGEPYCEEHSVMKCGCCGEQATHDCPETMGLVCGVYLCDNCEHTRCANGCNSGDDLPRGYSGHCKKEAQVYESWYIEGAEERNKEKQSQQPPQEKFQIGDVVKYHPGYLVCHGRQNDGEFLSAKSKVYNVEEYPSFQLIYLETPMPDSTGREPLDAALGYVFTKA